MIHLLRLQLAPCAFVFISISAAADSPRQSDFDVPKALGASNRGVVHLTPRIPFVQPYSRRFDPKVHTGAIVVKFVEGSGQRLRAGVVRHSDGRVNEGILEILAASGGMLKIERAFSRSEDALANEKAAGEAASGVQLPDLNLFYYIRPVRVITADEVERLVVLLRALEDVEVAYLEDRPAPPPRADISPPTPNIENEQGYLRPAPVGIDAQFASAIAGGRGQGTRFIDIEYGWNLAHEDLKDPFVAPLPYSCPWTDYVDCEDHGTAVLGMLVGDRNGFGVTGIVPDAEFSVAGAYNNGTVRVPDAINVAAANLRPGDVIIIELQTTSGAANSTNGCGYPSQNFGPMENDALVFSAVRTATANQRIVVAAAGNGSVSLDDPAFGGRNDRSSQNFQDSGAIIVGARVAGAASFDGAPTCSSTFGSRLDASGWGQMVTTTGGGAITSSSDQNQYYQYSFDGTSSATPIVAGAALAAQGIQRARGGPVIGPQAMRALISLHGTPQTPSARHIGSMPNLRAIHNWMLADNDADGLVNIDELALGSNPDLDETLVTVILRLLLG